MNEQSPSLLFMSYIKSLMPGMFELLRLRLQPLGLRSICNMLISTFDTKPGAQTKSQTQLFRLAR